MITINKNINQWVQISFGGIGGVYHLLKNFNHIMMWWGMMIFIISEKSLIKLEFRMVLQFCIDHMGFEFTLFSNFNQVFDLLYLNLIPFTTFYL